MRSDVVPAYLYHTVIYPYKLLPSIRSVAHYALLRWIIVPVYTSIDSSLWELSNRHKRVLKNYWPVWLRMIILWGDNKNMTIVITFLILLYIAEGEGDSQPCWFIYRLIALYESYQIVIKEFKKIAGQYGLVWWYLH